jgi:hypothetical protein
MTKSITQQIEDPDKREEFSDDLERYVGDAANEISRLAGEVDHDTVGDEYFHRMVKDIIMENIYVPVIMGESKTIKVVASGLNE